MKFCVKILFLTLIQGALFTNSDNLQNENSNNITNRDRRIQNLDILHPANISTAGNNIEKNHVTTLENYGTSVTSTQETISESTNKIETTNTFTTKHMEKENDILGSKNFSKIENLNMIHAPNIDLKTINDSLQNSTANETHHEVNNITTTEKVTEYNIEINTITSNSNDQNKQNEKYQYYETNTEKENGSTSDKENYASSTNTVKEISSENTNVVDNITSPSITDHMEIENGNSDMKSFTSNGTNSESLYFTFENTSETNHKVNNITATENVTEDNIEINTITSNSNDQNKQNEKYQYYETNIEKENSSTLDKESSTKIVKEISSESTNVVDNITSPSTTDHMEIENGTLDMKSFTSKGTKSEPLYFTFEKTNDSFTNPEITIKRPITSIHHEKESGRTTNSKSFGNFIIPKSTSAKSTEITTPTPSKYEKVTKSVAESFSSYETSTTTEVSQEISSESTTESYSTTDEPTEPYDSCNELGLVTNLNIKPSEFSLHVKWSNPKPDCPYKYIIVWEGSENKGKDTTDKTEYEITELLPCEKYTVSVQIFYGDSHIGEPELNSTSTLEHILPVENLKTDFNKEEKYLLITWNIANSVQYCYTATILQMYIKDVEFSMEIVKPIKQFKLVNVSSCINYTISAQAKSSEKISEKKTTNFSHPDVNDPPIPQEVIVQDDVVLTKWKFDKRICQPENFTVTCISEDKIEIVTEGDMDLQNNELTANITDIEPYMTYTCTGMIINSAGSSIYSEPIKFTTKSKPPSPPPFLSVEETENRSLIIRWESPEEWNGEPESIKIKVEYLRLNYDLVEGCKEDKPRDFSTNVTADETEFVYDYNDIIPAATYEISVAAESDGGWGEANTTKFSSSEGIPEQPANVDTKILNANTISSTYNVSLQVIWETPCKMHGKLKQYSVELCENQTDCKVNSIGAHNSKQYSYKFPLLKSETQYDVKVWAKNYAPYNGESAERKIKSPAGIPKIIEENIIEPNPTIVEEPWKSAVVYISNNMFDETNGKILYYSIIVGTEYCAEKPIRGIYDNNIKDTWPKIKSDNSSCTGESRAYEATPRQWNPLTSKTFRYILGNDENCTKIDCNKPLIPSTAYYVKIRGFTKHGYTDTKLLKLNTAAYGDVPVGLIVGLIVGILAIAFIIAAVLFYTKGKLNFKNWSRGSSGSQISPAPLPVPLKKFGTHYEKMIENPGKIKNEFQLLSTISSDVTLSTKTAMLPMNKKKNRYINILPYDQTRVKLEVKETNSTDYINASFIKGYSGSNEFIATQGPTEQTCPAFWQMVLEQNVSLIIMLTQFVEMGKEKCYKYFPDLQEEHCLLNGIDITCLEQTSFDTHYKRVFQVKKRDTDIIGKKITHLQFIQWPDFGVPTELHKMVEFCEVMRGIRRKERGSLTIVHCSAGVGRTGTLVAVDILQQSIRDKRKVDIFGTVLSLRKQRMNMVQSEKQYEFLYRITYYIVTNKVTNRPSKDSLLSISESDML